MRDIVLRGLLLRVGGRNSKRYVCWDSFKARYYLGKKRSSEIFAWYNSVSLGIARKLFPTVHLVYLEDKTAI